MKNSLYICFVLLISCQAFSQTKKNEWKTMNLKGKVKTLIDTTNYVLSNGNTSFTTIISFDSIGSILSKKMITKEFGKVIFTSNFSYNYDSLGRKIQEKKLVNGKLKNSFFITYNEEGDTLSIFYPNSNSTYSYEYDKPKSKIEIWYKRKKMKSHKHRIMRYYPNGNLKEVEKFDSNGKMKNKQVLKYDEKGLKKETYFIESNGDFGNRVVYERDTLGREIRIRHFKEFDKELIKEFTFQYNEYNNITTSTEKIPVYEIDSEHHLEYEYDKYGNYTIGKKYESDKLWIVTNRKIIYYH